MTRLRHFLEFVLFALAGALVRALPLRSAQSVGAAVGEFAFKGLGYRRGITIDNLRRAFPEYQEARLHDLARESFRSVGSAFFEFLWFPRLTKESIRDLVELENKDIAERALDQGKPIIFLTGHFGSWELAPQSVTAHTGLSMLIIVKTQENRLIDRTVNSWRMRFGNSVVPMAQSVREVLKTLQEGGATGIAGDQSASKESVRVQFFGRLVPTHQGPAAFALRTGAVIIMGFVRRNPDGRFFMKLEEVPWADLNPEAPDSVRELTRRHVALMERVIREHPGQWMWMHRRWKHADGEPPAGDEHGA